MKKIYFMAAVLLIATISYAYQYGSGYQQIGGIIISGSLTSIDGGSSVSEYLLTQIIDGGGADGS
jgi:hypothetical protein